MAGSAVATGIAAARSAAKARKWPSVLEPGQTVALIAPASPTTKKDVEDVTSRLSALGLKARPMPHVLDKTGLFAGSDADRADDFNAAIADPGIHAIACIRGGWGCGRILPLIDWDAVRSHAKPIVGFSDVTSLLLATWHRARLVSYHGMWAPRIDDPVTTLSWKSALMGRGTYDLFSFTDAAGELRVNSHGERFVSGTLLGGNLTVIDQMVGTGFLPSLREAIAFFEDLDEAPYRLDRMLTQLKQSGQFTQVRAIVLGQFLKCDDAELHISAADTLDDFFAGLGKPLVSNAPFGHIRRQVIVPVGAAAELGLQGDPALRILRP